MKKIWNGTHHCDICGDYMPRLIIDGKTVSGAWATMCARCFARFGIGIGVGAGQMYQRDSETGEYVKIRG